MLRDSAGARTATGFHVHRGCRGSGASERELEALAIYMGHSLEMQRGSYDRCFMQHLSRSKADHCGNPPFDGGTLWEAAGLTQDSTAVGAPFDTDVPLQRHLQSSPDI